MPVRVGIGAFFILVSIVSIAFPNTVNRLDNAKRRALLGDEAPALRNRLVGQRIAGVVLLVAGVALVVVGAVT